MYDRLYLIVMYYSCSYIYVFDFMKLLTPRRKDSLPFDFVNQFAFPLKVREIGINFYTKKFTLSLFQSRLNHTLSSLSLVPSPCKRRIGQRLFASILPCLLQPMLSLLRFLLLSPWAPLYCFPPLNHSSYPLPPPCSIPNLSLPSVQSSLATSPLYPQAKIYLESQQSPFSSAYAAVVLR